MDRWFRFSVLSALFCMAGVNYLDEIMDRRKIFGIIDLVKRVLESPSGGSCLGMSYEEYGFGFLLFRIVLWCLIGRFIISNSPGRM